MNPLMLIKPLMGLAGGLIKNPVVDLVINKTTSAISHKLEKDKIIKAKEIEAAKQVDVAKIGVQLEQVKQQENSWKDEWFAILLSAPIVAVLYGVGFNDPAVMGRVHDAFEALGNLPEWYQYLLFIAVTSSFGIRGADKLMKLRK